MFMQALKKAWKDTFPDGFLENIPLQDKSNGFRWAFRTIIWIMNLPFTIIKNTVKLFAELPFCIINKIEKTNKSIFWKVVNSLFAIPYFLTRALLSPINLLKSIALDNLSKDIILSHAEGSNNLSDKQIKACADYYRNKENSRFDIKLKSYWTLANEKGRIFMALTGLLSISLMAASAITSIAPLFKAPFGIGKVIAILASKISPGPFNLLGLPVSALVANSVTIATAIIVTFCNKPLFFENVLKEKESKSWTRSIYEKIKGYFKTQTPIILPTSPNYSPARRVSTAVSESIKSFKESGDFYQPEPSPDYSKIFAGSPVRYSPRIVIHPKNPSISEEEQGDDELTTSDDSPSPKNNMGN